jgi:hypothetical protein
MFCREIDKLKIEGKPIEVILMYSEFAHDIPRIHGYSIKGKRCYGIHNWGAKGRTNAIGALIGHTLFAIELLPRSVNTDVFTRWVEQILLSALPNKALL